MILQNLTKFLLYLAHDQAYNRDMKHIPMTSLAAFAAFALFAPTSQAQIRVESRIHASSGECAQCDLSNKRMNGVKLKDSNFAGALFNNSNLSGGQIDGSNLTGAHFRKALLYRVHGDKVMMESAVLEDATMTEAKVTNSILRSANLLRADLSRAHFEGNDFTASNLTSVKAPSVNFTGSNFSDAQLYHVNLREAVLDEASFKDVSFGFATLTDASLKGTDFSDAKMSNVQGLKQSQLDLACGNAMTELPDGLSIPYCVTAAHSQIDHNHDDMTPKMAHIARRLDRAIRDVELLLDATPPNNRPMKRKLQSIHSDLVQSKDALEK
ncbi:uncharacterized protein YjbI with pentapeptide repeats [Litorimonas taeanensis]|uniref:Uncharacterized protein YjbI with pentapeptide repeats n=2 Tax=Litorimonas taeanensis TaxID=568099 RepID=A0A420WMC9_9PROT|nr:uncharacterized protein YjbI with pentapeptide repeats [Litorimonas taeanensis]